MFTKTRGKAQGEILEALQSSNLVFLNDIKAFIS